MGVEVYRLKTGLRKGSAGTGNWEYFERQEKFEEALLLAGLSKLANSSREGRLRWFSAQRWLELISKSEDKHGWKTDEVFEAAKLVDGEWVVLEWHVTPPTLVYDVQKNKTGVRK